MCRHLMSVALNALVHVAKRYTGRGRATTGVILAIFSLLVISTPYVYNRAEGDDECCAS